MVFVVSGLEIGACGLEKASRSILVPHADRMLEEVLFQPFCHKLILSFFLYLGKTVIVLRVCSRAGCSI